MDLEALKAVLPKGKKEPSSASMPTLAMVNASFAVLSVPFQIIKSVRAGEEELWCSPA